MASDRRTKYTKSVIRESLFELLKERPIGKITVTDICKGADINRSTFYSYYEDVNDLLTSIQNELFENIMLTLNSANWFEDILKLVDGNRDLCRVLIGPHGDATFLRQLIYLGYENGVKLWKKNYPDAPEELLDYFYAFISSGVIGILENWIFSDYALSIEEVGKMLVGFSMEGIRFLGAPSAHPRDV